ncbi:hypothetical protein FPZ43_02330 [Mucilaginibacter pallidiroseus]|uniref:histidine kinase n=1 Tax=Mucilaginibacter pallidiroseus TaxID=2599295 RepID=A0A563UIW8_9SPHI|nr:HAMP domain-containing sensor histidine kinase [Mucilaginibacter pallidiroseus]TWR31334.1 hypothetical protein FPZ43_02330 [Mucilaginibacter pallidiroseus]
MICLKTNSFRNLYLLCWLFAFVLAAPACTKKQSAVDNGDYSPGFKKIRQETEALWAKDKVKKGLDHMDSAFSKLKNRTLLDYIRFYGMHYVYYQKTIKQYDTALVYADSMLMVARKGINTKDYAMNYAEANFCRGDALFEQRQFADAYQAYYQGYITGKSYFNLAAVADYTYRMGMIMYKQGHYKLAGKYFADSYTQNVAEMKEGVINRSFVGFYRRQELLDNIGLSFKKENQNDSALVYFNKALAEIDSNEAKYPERKLHVNMARGVVYGNMAEVYIQKGENAKAENLLKKSIAINLGAGYDNRDAQLTEIKLAKIYLEEGKTDSLFNLLTKIRSQLDTVMNDEAEAGVNRLLSDYYADKKQPEKALDYLQKYNVLNDSLTKRASLLMETDVNQQLANYDKQHQIDALSTNNKLQTIYLYVTVFFSAMAVIIIFLILRNWQRSKKDVKTVNELNKQINKQNAILENTLSDLNQSSQEKDRILRTVAHDLRNPIGGIAALTSIMVEDDYTEDQKELINLVKDTSNNSLELINEILEAANISSVEMNRENVEINSLVSNSVELLRFKASEKGQQILFDQLDRQQELFISREKIWRVISNLISNAIKFSPVGGLIQVRVAEVGHRIVVAVKDNGIGIPDKLKDQIFNTFTNAQRPGTSGEKSFGLGLSICKQIMEKHNGKIWFESNQDAGTTFFISLPFNIPGVQQNGLPQKVTIPVS